MRGFREYEAPRPLAASHRVRKPGSSAIAGLKVCRADERKALHPALAASRAVVAEEVRPSAPHRAVAAEAAKRHRVVELPVRVGLTAAETTGEQ